MSMLDADGLMMLPRGVKGGKDRIDDGESHTVLLSRRGCQHSGIVTRALHLASVNIWYKMKVISQI